MKLKRNVYFFLFAVSGFSGLIYESIWTHYLKLFLGHAAYSQTLVLIIFMGGMAVGAGIIGKYSSGLKNLLLGYAIVELVIGLFGIFFHSVFIQSTGFIFGSIIPQLNSVFLIDLVKWGMAALLILPQSILLGATFPLMSGGILRNFPEKPGKSLAVLYFLNSFGAAIGILISGFFLIEFVGLPGTILIAGLANIILASLVWLLSRKDQGPVLPEVKKNQSSSGQIPGKFLFLFFICAGLTGTASFLYEIGWIRMLSLVMGSTTHSFELMLSAFIFGLAIGGYWIKNRIDHLKNPVKTLGIIQLVMGFFALSTLLSYGKTFDFMIYFIKGLAKTSQGYGLFNILSHGLCMIIMLPATICAGMTLPIIIFYLISRGHGEGSIGKIYATNTLGSIVGVLLGVQLIMPVLGLKSVIVIGASIDILLGIFLLGITLSKFGKVRWLVMGMVSLVVILVSSLFFKLDPIKMTSSVYSAGEVSANKKILFHKDGKTSTVDFIEFPNDIQALANNGRIEAFFLPSSSSIADAHNILAAVLPLAYHKNIKTVATVGIGSGKTSHVLLYDHDIQSVDVIEIEAAMVEGARGFGRRVANTFNDPRCFIHIEDAKTFFTRHNKKFDLIISFPSPPWVSGVAGLFSKEFYHLVDNYLMNDGLFVQWVTLFEVDVSLVASIIKALSINFKDYIVYFTDDNNMMLIASQKKLTAAPVEWLFKSGGIKNELAHIGILNRQDLQLRKLGRKNILDPFFNSYDIPANSDFFPILDFGSIKTMYLKKDAKELIRLKSVALPLIETLEGDPIPDWSMASRRPLHFSIAHKVHRARGLLEHFKAQLDQYYSPKNNISKKDLQIIHQVRSIHFHSRFIDIADDWLTSLQLLAEATLPYLSVSEMGVIWKDIESSSSFSLLPRQCRAWFDLYKELSQRNFKRVKEISSIMLARKNITLPEKNNYLLTALLLSHLVLREKEEALLVWKAYENQHDPPVEMRILMANIFFSGFKR